MPLIKVTELGKGEGPKGEKVIFNREGAAIVIREDAKPYAQILLAGDLEAAEKKGYKLTEPAEKDTPGKGGEESVKREAPKDKAPSDHKPEPELKPDGGDQGGGESEDPEKSKTDEPDKGPGTTPTE